MLHWKTESWRNKDQSHTDKRGGAQILPWDFVLGNDNDDDDNDNNGNDPTRITFIKCLYYLTPYLCLGGTTFIIPTFTSTENSKITPMLHILKPR